MVSQSCTTGAAPPPFLASKPASFSSLAPPGFSAPGGKSPNVGVLCLSLCLLGLGLALGIFYQKKTDVRPVIWEGGVLGVDEPPLPILLGSHSALGQAPQGRSSRREAARVGFPIIPSPSLPLLLSQWQERRETQNGREGVGDPQRPWGHPSSQCQISPPHRGFPALQCLNPHLNPSYASRGTVEGRWPAPAPNRLRVMMKAAFS